MRTKLTYALLIALAAVYLSALARDTFFFVITLNVFLWLLILVLAGVVIVFLKNKLALKSRVLVLLAGIVSAILIYACFRFYPGNSRYIQALPAEKLKSLSYVTWVSMQPQDMQKTGVTRYNRALSFRGNNLYNSRNLSRACLMDMSGNILHAWEARIDARDSWQYVRLLPDNGLLAIVKDKLLIRLDRDSRIKWFKRMRFHHDIELSQDNRVWTLAWKDEVVFISGIPLPVLNDYVLALSADGRVEKEISLFNILKNEISPGMIFSIYRQMINPRFIKSVVRHKIEGRPVINEDMYAFDVFHANTVEVAARDIPGVCRKGDILVSLRNLNLIGIIGGIRENLIWKWGKNVLSGQHHPTFLKNNNILVFDNGLGRGYSRAIEVDPRAGSIVWEYKAAPPGSLYSQGASLVQRLPNANTLITNSDRGYAFEVTPAGEVVWEFYNPEVNAGANARAVIATMLRITE